MTAPPTEYRLWTPDGFRDDLWRHAPDAEAAADHGGIILPFHAFAALERQRRAALAGRLGVLLAPAEPLAEMVPLLDGLALVALAFPAFNDGRSFSKAELLRRRYGFAEAIRASGEVLIDQIPHMIRTGFTEFEVRDATTLARLEAGRIGGLPLHYQPSAKAAGAAAPFSWRRVA